MPLLRGAGYDVYAPTLTGTGSNSHLAHELNRISLGTHIKDITNLLFYEDLTDVVLVGHSYAGMVITGVAAEESRRLSHLIYLDAYLPFEGENLISLWPPAQKEKYLSDIASDIKFRPPLKSSDLGITDPEMSKWVQERLTPHPYSTYEDAPPFGSLQDDAIRRAYIHCTRGLISSWMNPFSKRAKELGWDVYSMDASHGVMITHPDEIAKILVQIANR